MRRIAGAGLLFVSVLACGTASAAPGTIVTLKGGTGQGEVCRFRAGVGEDPFQRWLSSQEVTCVASGSSMTWAPGRWNVFARSEGAVSTDPILVDGASPPETLTISLAPAATLAVQLPAGHTGVLYAPKRVTAFPAAERTTVPSAEELWLFVLAKSVPVAVVVIPPLDAGSERVVDARDASPSSAVVAWVRLPDVDRAALKTAHGVSSPNIRVTSAGNETNAASLPAPEALDGAIVLLQGASAGNADLQLTGRGWLPFRQTITVRPQSVTLVRQPIVARASATLVVNWSTLNDLAALDRSFGSCEPPAPPRFDLTISACAPPRPGEAIDAAACQPIKAEPLVPAATYGSVTVGEVPPGTYRAELRFGKLPPIAVTTVLAPLQQQPILLQAVYLQVYGSLTRGGQPLGEDAGIAFPRAGVGFLAREQDEYHGVLTVPIIEIDAKIDIATCRGQHALVLTDRPMMRNARFDIDIPDNVLTVTVIDTFTRMPVREAMLRYTVMSSLVRVRGPRVPLFTRPLKQDDADGRFVIKAVPVREIHLQVSSPGYKTQDLEPFSMSKSGKKDIEVQLVPLSGSQGKIVSPRPFERATIFWFSASGVETEHADLAPDGTFFFEETHLRSETMTVVSLSHPLWVTRAPAVERARPLEVRFPDAAPVRDAEVWVPGYPERMATLIGVAIGGLRVPAPALAQHLALRGGDPWVRGAGPLRVPALAETGPIEILRGPSTQQGRPLGATMDALALRDFAPISIRPLVPGIDRVVFEGK